MRPEPKDITDLSEKGFTKSNEPTSLDERLYIQLLVFGGCKDNSEIIDYLNKSEIEGILYNDLNDPHGIGLVTMSRDPDFFATRLRKFFDERNFESLIIKNEYTMIGRTYSLGHERDLRDWLLERSKRILLKPENKWTVWYPLKRTGAFSLLPPKEHMDILREHGTIGRAFGEAGLAQDIRLACYGLDKNDNDFVIGLVGEELMPLSAIVQAMRKTRQTSTYIEKMGPFFVGKAVWQSKNKT